MTPPSYVAARCCQVPGWMAYGVASSVVDVELAHSRKYARPSEMRNRY